MKVKVNILKEKSFKFAVSIENRYKDLRKKNCFNH